MYLDIDLRIVLNDTLSVHCMCVVSNIRVTGKSDACSSELVVT